QDELTGFQHLKHVLPLFARLHDAGCARDKAANRTLHYDQYCALVLLRMFNPVLATLRALQQASGLEKVRQKLGCCRASLGSLSESSHVFDPEMLVPVIAELGAQLRPMARDPR